MFRLTTLILFLLGAPLFLSAQQPFYEVKFPDDRTVIGCGASADTIWPTITQYGNCSFNVGVSVKDEVFYLNETNTCAKILRRFRLIYWCNYDPNWQPYVIVNPLSTDTGPTVQGNAANTGYLEYTQIIKVRDLGLPEFKDCVNGTYIFCDYTGNDPAQYGQRCEGPVDLSILVNDACSGTDINLSYRLFLDLDGNGSMETYISSGAPNAYPLVTGIHDDCLRGRVQLPAGAQLPYGKHKIEWIANDQCGNEAICKYEFEVKDCKPPTIVCLNGLSVNIMQTGMISMNKNSFILYYNDNCTPQAQVLTGIRKAGTGTGFPFDTQEVTFDCSELGTQPVEVWVRDAYGNEDYCITYVIVQDNIGACPLVSSLKGQVLTPDLKPVPGVAVKLKHASMPYNITDATDADGYYQFLSAVPAACGYSLTPLLDTMAGAGISAYDALLAAAHYYDVQQLPTPYHLVAADVDHSGAITGADVNQILWVVLGLQSDFDNNTVWQFVPKNWVFPDPANPFAAAMPHKLDLCLTPSGAAVNPDFVAIKTADLDGSAMSSSLLAGADDRAAQPPLYFTAPDVLFEAGDEVRVPILTPDIDGLAGFQLAVQYDLPFLELIAVEEGLAPAEWIGSFPDKGVVATGWINPEALLPDVATAGKNAGVPVMTLVFRALKQGGLKRALELDAASLRAEAYTAGGNTRPVGLRFVPAPATRQGLSVTDPWPNPASGYTAVSFYTPSAGPVTLSLCDPSGAVVHSRQIDCAAGYHVERFDLGERNASTMLFLRVESADGAAVRRVVLGGR